MTSCNMERVIQLLEHKRDQLVKIRDRQNKQFSTGKDITAKDVVFYDQELHEQLDEAILTLILSNFNPEETKCNPINASLSSFAHLMALANEIEDDSLSSKM